MTTQPTMGHIFEPADRRHSDAATGTDAYTDSNNGFAGTETATLATGCYESIDNPAYLRITIDELQRVHSFIEQFAQLAAEMPEVDVERAAGMRATMVLVTRLLEHAQHRLQQLTAILPPRGVLLLDPSEGIPIQLPHGQLLTPMVTEPNVATHGISSAAGWMPPGHVSDPHVCNDTDIIVVVLVGKAITIWWDADGNRHEVEQRAHQQVHIPRGIPHCAHNPGPQPVFAVLFRTNSMFNADNVLLPELKPALDDLRATAR